MSLVNSSWFIIVTAIQDAIDQKNHDFKNIQSLYLVP